MTDFESVHASGLAEKEARPSPFLADILAESGVIHGFFSRVGGTSEGIYASLNCGRGSRDDRDAVEENRTRVARHLGLSSARLIGPRQVHGAKVVVAETAWDADKAPEADAIVTARRGLALSVLTADCAPILIAEPNAGVAAAVHAGWKGAKAGVIEATVAAMRELKASPGRMAAAIGPTISRTAYEVGPEFMEAFLADNPANGQYFGKINASGHPHFDLAAYLKDKLHAQGIAEVKDLGLCTYEHESIFFSYRRSVHRKETDYGRQISAILLQ
jgi:YfiH family protein